MKKLLNTLYIISEDSYLSLDGENVVVQKGKEKIGRVPLHTIEGIVCFSYAGASPALMGACCEKNIGLTFFSPKGRFLARVVGEEYGNVLLRKEQYRISDSKELSCIYARNMILGKVYNCRWSLERTLRDHSLRVDSDKIRDISQDLKTNLTYIRECEDLDNLRGIEGQTASRYFSVFDELILNQKEKFYFRGRNRRPPLDNVNALLSLVYTVLTNEVANSLESVGLDPYVGFMHRDRPGRKSLALDMVEELRGVVADRFVVTLINKKIVKDIHFDEQTDGAVILTDEGRKQFFNAWQLRKKEQITHPFLNEKIEWGLVPYVQALLLARAIRGDIDEYPPFLWK